MSFYTKMNLAKNMYMVHPWGVFISGSVMFQIHKVPEEKTKQKNKRERQRGRWKETEKPKEIEKTSERER